MHTLDRAEWIPCTACRHAGIGFEAHAESDAEFLAGFRAGRGAMAAGEARDADAARPLLLTLYSGWVLRALVGPGGRETLLGVALPGDLVGAETMIAEKGTLRLRALTDITYCAFDPMRWRELLAAPSLADRLFRIEALARHEAEERQAAAAQLPAAGNLCHFLLGLYEGLRQRRLAREDSFHLPLARGQLAALLGMTPTHLRRVLAGLAQDGVLELRRDRVIFRNRARVRSLAGNPSFSQVPRPLL